MMYLARSPLDRQGTPADAAPCLWLVVRECWAPKW